MVEDKTLGRIFFWISVAGIELALLCAAADIGAGLGVRMRWWGFRFGFMLLAWAASGGAAAAGISLMGAAGVFFTFSSGRRIAAVIGLGGVLIGLTAFYVPWQWRQTARKAPPIHDITTDTENPPQFSAIILALRRDAPNGVDYQGAAVAEKQKAAYPDIKPLIIPLELGDAFNRAVDAVGKMKWETAGADKAHGRIEAVDTTFWFGFKDDVVIRLTPVEGGSKTRVDVRSVSRVGRSDIGTNAKRIRAYLRLMGD